MEHDAPRDVTRQVALLIMDVPSAKSGVVSVRLDQILAEASCWFPTHPRGAAPGP
jgi:hypothetical protein